MLTAAHCVRSYPVDIWTITAGAQQRVVPETHNQTFKADDIVIHEEFQVNKIHKRSQMTQTTVDL